MTPRLALLLSFACAALRAAAADAPTAPAVVAPAPVSPAAGTKPVSPAAGTARPAAASAPRNESSIAPSASFDAFRVVADRNIFNPNRTGRRERTVEEPAPRLDTITFVGMLDADGGRRAFFDGSDSSYRKALRAGESIDKFKIVSVSADRVQLERDGKAMTVALGQQLRRPEGADWTLVGEDVARREREAAARAAASATPDPSAPPAIPADASDTLRRLMEARAKQLKQ